MDMRRQCSFLRDQTTGDLNLLSVPPSPPFLLAVHEKKKKIVVFKGTFGLFGGGGGGHVSLGPPLGPAMRKVQVSNDQELVQSESKSCPLRPVAMYFKVVWRKSGRVPKARVWGGGGGAYGFTRFTSS